MHCMHCPPSPAFFPPHLPSQPCSQPQGAAWLNRQQVTPAYHPSVNTSIFVHMCTHSYAKRSIMQTLKTAGSLLNHELRPDKSPEQNGLCWAKAQQATLQQSVKKLMFPEKKKKKQQLKPRRFYLNFMDFQDCHGTLVSTKDYFCWWSGICKAMKPTGKARLQSCKLLCLAKTGLFCHVEVSTNCSSQ